MTHEADECVWDDAHGIANKAQLEYFKAREFYKSLSDEELINALKICGVPEILIEVIENRLAGSKSV